MSLSRQFQFRIRVSSRNERSLKRWRSHQNIFIWRICQWKATPTGNKKPNDSWLDSCRMKVPTHIQQGESIMSYHLSIVERRSLEMLHQQRKSAREIFPGTKWIGHRKRDNFFKGFKTIRNGCPIISCSMNAVFGKPVHIIVSYVAISW